LQHERDLDVVTVLVEMMLDIRLDVAPHDQYDFVGARICRFGDRKVEERLAGGADFRQLLGPAKT
jgi:hypothetical protein